jgi:hypothetical protein
VSEISLRSKSHQIAEIAGRDSRAKGKVREPGRRRPYKAPDNPSRDEKPDGVSGNDVQAKRVILRQKACQRGDD